MANETSLPRQNSQVTDGTNFTPPWYNFFRRLADRLSAVENAPPVSGGGDSITNIYGFDGMEKTVQDATTARTLSSDDNLTNVEFTSASAVTVTVNKDTLPENSVTYLTQGGAGQVTVVAGSGVTIDYSDSLKTRTQESMIGLKQIQVNKFELFGDAEPVAPARSVLIRAANSVGAPAWVAPTADNQKLKRISGALAWGTDTASEIANVPAGNIAATTIQAALDELDTEKQAKIVLTASRAMVTDASGFPAVSATTATQLGYVNGVTSAIQTQLNARQTRSPAVQTVTSAATITPATANDMVVVTALAVDTTVANPSGSWSQGQNLVIRMKDNGTARTLTKGAGYRDMGATFPATTVAGKTTYIFIMYNSTDTKWDVYDVRTEP